VNAVYLDSVTFKNNSLHWSLGQAIACDANC
jgi:hypothetical protein